MKFTKKIMTMATCAVMAASSMVGMSASAYNINDGIDTASVSVDGSYNPEEHNGTYYSDDGSFIQISGTNADNAQALFYKIDCTTANALGSYNNLSGVGDILAIGTTGHSFHVALSANDWTYEVNGVLKYGNNNIELQGNYYSNLFGGNQRIVLNGINYYK